MINAILTGFFNVIISLVNVVLSPIDLLISQFLPDLNTALNSISAMFSYVGNFLGFAVSITGLSSTALSLIVMYYTFKLTVPILVSSLKSAVKWYNSLKL